jgi:hypothetical protein
MNAISGLLGLAGIVLVAVAMLDVLWTTLSTTGGGPLSSGLARGLWRSARGLQHWSGSSRPLQLVGPAILLASLLLWVVLLWAGWTLLFSASPDAVRALQTDAPASPSGRVYFVGYTLFTLGIGNYVPAPGGWEIVTAVASLNGLFLITLSITYLVAVLSAATRKHQLATVIATLGCTPHDIVCRAWTDDDLASFRAHLVQLVSMIERHARNHLAYPVLHYFHSPQRRVAVSLRLAALDDALLLMEHGLASGESPGKATLAPAREAIEDLLSTLHGAFIRPSETAPPVPSLQPLAEAGLPIAEEAAYRRATDGAAPRRRLMEAYVEDDGWEWADIDRVAAPTPQGVPVSASISGSKDGPG